MLYPTELRAQPERKPTSTPAWRSSVGRGSRIRTCDPLLPKQMRYQTAPCPVPMLTNRPARDIPPRHTGARMIRSAPGGRGQLTGGCSYRGARSSRRPVCPRGSRRPPPARRECDRIRRKFFALRASMRAAICASISASLRPGVRRSVAPRRGTGRRAAQELPGSSPRSRARRRAPAVRRRAAWPWRCRRPRCVRC